MQQHLPPIVEHLEGQLGLIAVALDSGGRIFRIVLDQQRRIQRLLQGGTGGWRQVATDHALE
ncbi:hypothetical protein D3C84_1081750 [compost metagenome]